MSRGGGGGGRFPAGGPRGPGPGPGAMGNFGGGWPLNIVHNNQIPPLGPPILPNVGSFNNPDECGGFDRMHGGFYQGDGPHNFNQPPNINESNFNGPPMNIPNFNGPPMNIPNFNGPPMNMFNNNRTGMDQRSRSRSPRNRNWNDSQGIRRRSRSNSGDRRRRQTRWGGGENDNPASTAGGAPVTSNMEILGQAQLEMMKAMGCLQPMTGPQIPINQMAMNNMGMQMPVDLIGGYFINPKIAAMGQGMPDNRIGNKNILDEKNISDISESMNVAKINLTDAILLPPLCDKREAPMTDRPPYCRTISVNIPERVRENTVRELFDKCGIIESIKFSKTGCIIRYLNENSVKTALSLNGYRLKILNDPFLTVAVLNIDYAVDSEDRDDYERMSTRKIEQHHIEPIAEIQTVFSKIKSEETFGEAVPSLVAWLERGECNNRNINTFYSMIQMTNNQTRRLLNEKIQFEEEFQAIKDEKKEKALKIVAVSEQVLKVLNAANSQRVRDLFSKQQRKNVETWHKMTEELNCIKEDFSRIFDDDADEDQEYSEKSKKIRISEDTYNDLKNSNRNLKLELEACKNEVHVAKVDAAKQFEKFKAQFVAGERLKKYNDDTKAQTARMKTSANDIVDLTENTGSCSQARLISVVSAHLLTHPSGTSLDTILSYIRSLRLEITHSALQQVMHKHKDVFKQTNAKVEKWKLVSLDQ